MRSRRLPLRFCTEEFLSDEGSRGRLTLRFGTSHVTAGGGLGRSAEERTGGEDGAGWHLVDTC